MNSNSMCNKTSWREIQIDNEHYMIYINKEINTWKILLTNLVDLRIEVLSDEAIVKKVEELNPLLSTETLNCNEILMNLFEDISKYVTEASVDQIKLRFPIGEGVLKFSLNFKKATPEEFWENVTMPLCLTSMALVRQQKELFKIIQKKDEEIAEYKAEGAELIRKNIETKVFNKNQFLTNLQKLEATNCKDAFQEIISLYNVMNVSKSPIKTEPSSTRMKADEDSKEFLEDSKKLLEDAESMKNIKGKTSTQMKNRRNRRRMVQSTLQSTSIVINKSPPKRKLLSNFIS